jgi:hypothetical protein
VVERQGPRQRQGQCDAGHWIGRGLGGSSGVYFHEKNIHAQCKQCNGWDATMHDRYDAFMLEKYGENQLNLLRWQHKNYSYKDKLPMVELQYKQMYLQLAKEWGIE